MTPCMPVEDGLVKRSPMWQILKLALSSTNFNIKFWLASFKLQKPRIKA